MTATEELTGHPPSPNQVRHTQSLHPVADPAIMRREHKHTRAPGLNGLLDDAFFQDGDVALEIEHEKPWHRLAIEYTLQGLDQNEIADLLKRSRESVRRVLRQPWAREKIIQRSKMTTMDQVKTWLENECIPNLEVIKAVRDNPEVRPADRRGAAEYLTDRFLGKAVQPVQQAEAAPTTLTKDEIERRVAKLAEGVETP